MILKNKSYKIHTYGLSINIAKKGRQMKKILLVALGSVSCSLLLNAAAPADIIKTKCQACHGANMEKQALGKSKIANAMTPEDIKKDLLGYKAGTLNHFGLGATMWGQAKALSDQEIDELSKYIPTLKK